MIIAVAQKSWKRDPCAQNSRHTAIRNTRCGGARRSWKIAERARKALQGGLKQPRSAALSHPAAANINAAVFAFAFARNAIVGDDGYHPAYLGNDSI